MYPYLWIMLKKLFKGCWYRHFASKRERTTAFSSLHECLEQSAKQSVFWRNWFLLLLILPPLYYFGLIQIWWRNDLSQTSESRLLSQQYFRTVTPETMTPAAYYDEEPPYRHSVHQLAARTYNKSNGEQDHNNASVSHNLQNKRTRYTMPNVVKHYGSRTPIALISSSNKLTMPWCRFRINKTDTVVKFGEMSCNQTYGKLVQLGGYHSPNLCRSRHKVAIIVPFRNRQINLAVFLFNIHPFLINQMLEYRIFVVEQSGKELFNKGRLFNAGYVEAMKLAKWDCMIFHDVDLLPISKHILYSCPVWPRHMCGTVVEDRNHSTFHTFFGGVSSMSTKQFASVNGYSNLYWGWGGEDTDMFWRIRAAGFPMVRYQKDIAKYLSLPHDKTPECKNRIELVKTAIGRYSYDGLTTLSYRLLSMKLLHLYTHILVDIGSNNITATLRKVAVNH